jgi:hypothetical protein
MVIFRTEELHKSNEGYELIRVFGNWERRCSKQLTGISQIGRDREQE